MGAATLISTSCLFSATPPSDATTIRCEGTSTSQCPPLTFCALKRSGYRCVPEGTPSTPPSVVSSATRVSIIPDANNPLSAPTALGPHGTALIECSVSTALSEAPTLTPSVPALSCVLRENAATRFSWACRLDASAADAGMLASAVATFSVAMVDVDENPAVEPLSGATLRIDSTPPPPVDTASPTRVELTLAPWGGLPSPAQGSSRVVATAAATREATWVAVSDHGLEVARALVSQDGSFGPLDLPLTVSAALTVVAIDEAGNSSPGAPIRDVRWTATIGGKVALDTSKNPHRLQLVGAMGAGVVRTDAVEQGDSDGVAAPGGLYASVRGASSWAWKTNEGPRGGHHRQMVWDKGRARLLTFEAETRNTNLNVVEWTGDDWLAIEPNLPEGPEQPPGRDHAAVAYDEFSQQTLVFGGTRATGVVLGDTWLWNGRAWKPLRGAGPSPRLGSAAWYDANLAGVVLFGGQTADGGAQDDTWLFQNGAWRPLDAGAPTRRAWSGAAFDAFRGNSLLLGGFDPTWGHRTDAWRLDRGQWRPDPGFDTGLPGPRSVDAVAIHPTTGQTLCGHPAEDAVWTSTDAGWGVAFSARGTTDGGLPGDLYGLVFDSAHRQWLLYPGSEATWAFANRTLRKVSTDLGGTTRRYHELQFSPDGDGPLLGLNLTGNTQAFYSWNGEVFSNAGEVVFPGIHGQCAMHGTAPTLVQLCTFSTNVNDFIEHRVDTSRLDAGVTVVTHTAVWPTDAGFNADGVTPLTAQVAGETWVLHPAFNRFLIVNDAGVTLGPVMPAPIFDWGLFETGPLETSAAIGFTDGGAFAVSLNGSAQWAGNQFQLFPSPRLRNVSVTWNAARQRFVALGSELAATEARRTLELTPTGWQVMPLSDPEGDGDAPRQPPNRTAARYGLAYDALTQGVFANIQYEGPMLQRAATHRPGALFRVELRGNNRPSGGRPTELFGQFIARAQSQAGGAQSTALKLWVWELGAWTELSDVQRVVDGTTGFVTLGFAVRDAARVASLVDGQPELVLAVTPAGTNGTDWATLDVDYVEASLRWRVAGD